MIHNLLAKLKKTPPWVWITIAIGGVGLVIAYLAYKQQQANAGGAASGADANGVSPTGYSGGYSGGATGSVPQSGDATGGSSYNDSNLLARLDALIAALSGGGGATPPPPVSPAMGPVPAQQVPPGSGAGMFSILSGAIGHSDFSNGTTPHPLGGPVPAEHYAMFASPGGSPTPLGGPPVPAGSGGYNPNAPSANAPGGAGPGRAPHPFPILN